MVGLAIERPMTPFSPFLTRSTPRRTATSKASAPSLSSALLLTWVANAATAQSVAPTPTPTPPAAAPITQQIVVTGKPLQRDVLAQPASVLSGEALLMRRAATLGETQQHLVRAERRTAGHPRPGR